MGKICIGRRLQPAKSRALGSAATAILLMVAAAGATAQTLPGDFSTNQSGTTYSPTATNTATIAIGTSAPNSVLQWGGPLSGGTPVSSGSVPGASGGFSIGSVYTLKMTGGNGATLVNDITPSTPSLIYGKLDASALNGPLYIANASGIIVGPSGNITGPSGGGGVGLLAYSISSPETFNGTVSITQGTSGGSVTVMSGASITGGPILVAGAGTVNVSLPNTYVYASGHSSSTTTIFNSDGCSKGCSVNALAGIGFSTGPDSVVPLGTSKPFPPPPHHHHWW